MPDRKLQSQPDRKPLSRVEAIRKRPGMYIGRTDGCGLLQCIEEVLAGIYQRHKQTRFGRIEIILHPDHSVSIGSNDPTIFRPATIFSRFLDGIEKEFSQWARSALPYVLGQAGVGPSCICALSEWMCVRVVHGSQVYEARYRWGDLFRSFHRLSNIRRKPTDFLFVRFEPDAQIFRDATFEFEPLAWRLREIAVLTPGLRIRLIDRREQKVDVSCHYPKGLVGFVEDITARAARLHGKPLIITGSCKGVSVEIGLQFDTSQNFQLFSYVNFRATHFGGTDIEGLLAGIASAIDAHGFDARSKHTPESIRFGLTAVLNVKLKNPMYYGATKERLLNPEVFDAVRTITSRGLKQYFKTNPEIRKDIWLHLDSNKFWVETMRRDIYR